MDKKEEIKYNYLRFNENLVFYIMRGIMNNILVKIFNISNVFGIILLIIGISIFFISEYISINIEYDLLIFSISFFMLAPKRYLKEKEYWRNNPHEIYTISKFNNIYGWLIMFGIIFLGAFIIVKS